MQKKNGKKNSSTIITPEVICTLCQNEKSPAPDRAHPT